MKRYAGRGRGSSWTTLSFGITIVDFTVAAPAYIAFPVIPALMISLPEASVLAILLQQFVPVVEQELMPVVKTNPWGFS